MSKVVQFFAVRTGSQEPPGEHQFEVLEDGRVFERYAYLHAEPGPWIEILPPNSNVPNVTVTP